jgi:hypothetical protein
MMMIAADIVRDLMVVQVQFEMGIAADESGMKGEFPAS